MALQSGDTVGQYEIVGPLGQGGMAAVYKAYHPQLERYVAIKFIHQSFLEDVNFISRFQREAKIIARLDHPNIVPVYDYSEYDRQPYLVMKYIEGQTLKDLMTEMPMTEILDVMTGIASGLTYAHNQGVLHRDIKPGNIIVDYEMRPYITDFGLARIVQSGQSTLSQDMLLGTPHYVSPEQAKGVDKLGPPADIYSLGVVLYEIAVGRVPFSGNTPYAIVHDHIYSPLPRPRELNPEVSTQVEEVLIKALAKEPPERYQSAIELVAAFREATITHPETVAARVYTVARPPEVTSAPAIPSPLPQNSASATAAVEPRKTRRRIPWGLVALLLVALVVGLAVLRGRNRSGAATAVTQTASASQPEATIALYNALDLSLTEAQAAVEEDPQNIEAYLALAKAAWLNNQNPVAQQAIVDGAEVADDMVKFYLSAAQVADATDQKAAAMILHSQVLTVAESDSRWHPYVRAVSGEYLYYQSLEAVTVRVDSLERLQQTYPGFEPHPLLELMALHFPLLNGRSRMAELGFRRLAVAVIEMPEAHLVLGEIYKAQGNTEQARREWEGVAEALDAPGWVTQRAEELLRTLSGE
jgi:serine/threonine-protein kinase